MRICAYCVCKYKCIHTLYMYIRRPQPGERVSEDITGSMVRRNRARRHAKTNPGDINLKPPTSLLARRRSLLACRRAVTIYYFPARSPSNTTLIGISPIFPFSLLLSKEIEIFSLFQYQSKEKSCFGIAQVTFGTSTGHFWHVDGPLLLYYLQFSGPQPVQYYIE